MAAADKVTMRDVLLADALEGSEREALTTAMNWIEKSRAAVRDGRATLEEVDASQPFSVGSDAWFYYVLLMNKPCQTLHGPYAPLIIRGSTARSQAEFDGLVCGACHKAGGSKMTVKLRRCGHCQLISYCSRDCQRLHYKEHKGPCQEQQLRRANVKKAKPKFGRVVISWNDDDDHAVTDPEFPDYKLPTNPEAPTTKIITTTKALIARHLTDGFHRSSLILYEDIGQLNRQVKIDDEPFWAIATVPVIDDDLREKLLGPKEAVFNTVQYAREYDALIRWSVITPVLDKSFPYQPDENHQHNTIDLPIARIDIAQIPPDTLWGM